MIDFEQIIVLGHKPIRAYDAAFFGGSEDAGRIWFEFENDRWLVTGGNPENNEEVKNSLSYAIKFDHISHWMGGRVPRNTWPPPIWERTNKSNNICICDNFSLVNFGCPSARKLKCRSM